MIRPLKESVFMRIFFLGDIVGRSARQLVISASFCPQEEFNADFIIVNVENSAGGFGVTPEIADDFRGRRRCADHGKSRLG